MENEIIRWLIQWAENQEAIRVVILTSSRTRPDSPVDAFSDYDVILAIKDIHPFLQDDSWLEDYGRVLVVYRDPVHLWYGLEKFARITQYENGTKIDYTVVPVDLINRVVADPVLPVDLDDGYTVLLDKDGLTDRLKPSTHHAYIPAPPDEKEYQWVVEEFFHEATYLAKSLWRDDLMSVKYFLDQAMKQDNLRPMLEWFIEIENNWSLKTGVLGKGLKKRLNPEIWVELEHTYAGSGEEENWQAMFRTIDLFRKVAVRVNEHLGYPYPYDLDQRCMAHFIHVKQLARDAKSVYGSGTG